jgi:hypothetical protein
MMPQGWDQVDLAPFEDRSLLKEPFNAEGLIQQLSDWQVQGKPLIVSEWNDCFPNRWRVEGPLLMAAYGSLQGWGGMLQFHYGPEAPGSRSMDRFAINTRPDSLALFQAGALIYRGGLLKPSPISVLEPIDDAAALDPAARHRAHLDDAWLPYAVRVEKVFCAAGCPKRDLAPAQGLHRRGDKAVDASTGELSLDYGRGRLTFMAPGLRGWVGDMSGPLAAGALKADVSARDPWAALLLLSAHGDLERDGEALLFAEAGAENSGQRTQASGDRFADYGQAPVLLEGVDADVTLGLPGQWTVTLVGSKVRGPFKVAGSAAFHISSRDQCHYYRLRRSTGPSGGDAPAASSGAAN